MQHSIFLLSLLFAVISAAGGSLNPSLADQFDEAQEKPHWRSAVMCGPNSLFLVLNGTGYCDDYGTLCKNFSPTPEGVSVTQLLSAAHGYGCNLQAYKMNFDGLKNVSTPAILHLKPAGGVGHFVVLLEVLDKAALVMDSTTGETSPFSRGSLQDVWSGVVICESRPLISSEAMSYLGLFASLAFLGFVGNAALRSRAAKSFKRKKTVGTM